MNDGTENDGAIADEIREAIDHADADRSEAEHDCCERLPVVEAERDALQRQRDLARDAAGRMEAERNEARRLMDGLGLQALGLRQERDRLLVIAKRLRNIADTTKVYQGRRGNVFQFEDEPTHSFLVALGVDARDLLAELEGASR